MLISKLIEKLQKIQQDLGDLPISIDCHPNREVLTVAMWADGDCYGYIKAVTMPEKEPLKKRY